MANNPLSMEAVEQGPGGVGIEDPSFNAFRGSEAAAPEEDAQMNEYLADAMEFIYSKKGMAVIMRGLNDEGRELYETVPQISKLILEKTLGGMKAAKKVDSQYFFGEGGLLQQVPQMLFEIAQKLGIPGSDDPDQMSAALMATYKAAGEHVLESGDEESIIQAQSLGAEALLTQPDGSVGSPHQMPRAPAPTEKPNFNLLGVQ